MSEIEAILEFAEELVHTETDGYFSELQRMILLTAIQGSRKTYDEIADECGYSSKYLKQDVAPKLWHTLSQVLKEKVTKSNVKALLERGMRHLTPPQLPNLPAKVEPPLSVPTATVPPADSSAHSKGNILLVDDQPENLNLLSDLLEEQGYEVRQALNGLVALEAAILTPPDLILLDINMPELDGYKVCQRLKENSQTQEIPVIFVSALDEVWDKVRAFSVGGVDYISKPFKVIEVLARVENQLKLRHLQQELQVQNAHLQQAIQELQRLAAIDLLTQVANRSRFDDYFQSQWQQAQQQQYPLTLILCHLDRFKDYNDAYGKQAGDRCLYQVAQALKRAVQEPEALVCRYGGAEFAIILPKLNAARAQETAQTILQQVQKLQISFNKSPINPYVTVSIGIVSLIPNQQITPESLIELCSSALHQAETEGGNCWIINSVPDLNKNETSVA